MKKDQQIELPLYDAFVLLLENHEEDEVLDTIATINEDPKVHEDIYRLAKRYYEENKPLAIQLINTISRNLKYFYGFQAYANCIDHNEEGIDDMVNYQRLTYLINPTKDNEKDYTEIMNEVVFSIAEFCPEKVKKLLDEIHETIQNVCSGQILNVDE